MSFPSPTERQARLLWTSLTALATGILVGLIGLLLWGLGWVLNRMSSVLLPLAAAGILAYLLDPVVDFLEKRRKMRRSRAILWVFLLAVLLVLTLLGTLVPQLIVEVGRLVNELPTYAGEARKHLEEWLAHSAWGLKAQHAWETQLGATVQTGLTELLPVVSTWIWAQAGRVASWAGLLFGVALVPVYTFYFLLEKHGIQRNWKQFLPLHRSPFRDEIIFCLEAINDCLIVFFRGQVLVALSDGILLTIGFTALGLNYSLLLGLGAGLLSVVPYLGITMSLIPALALAGVQFGDAWHPLLVLGIFGLVQLLEGLFISPKIIGDRVGLHPLAVIIAVMVGTTLMGGLLGGLLAIPLTAALRTLMYRYVWRRERAPGLENPRLGGNSNPGPCG
jgi:predicted PurR-regulated permease PerM